MWLSWSKARRKHKKIWWSSEHRVATGTQRQCDTISGRISCLAPDSRAKNIENIGDTFHLYFDNDIMDKIIDCTNTKINETIERLQQSDNFNESSKYTWVEKPERVEIDALFGLMYFRGILGVNLHMTDKLFSHDSHFVFGAIMSKNRFRFLKGHICFDNPQERTQLWETGRFAAVREIWEIFNSNIWKHIAPSEYLSIDENFTQWDRKFPSASIIPINYIVMICYWSHWMTQDFLMHTKLYHMLQNGRLEMVPITWSLLLTA